jgi:hypothetical protein
MAELFPQGWQHYLAGGLLLGAGMSLLFLATGLIGGMSTVFTTVWSFLSSAPYFREERFVSSRAWRLVYALGIVTRRAGVAARIGRCVRHASALLAARRGRIHRGLRRAARQRLHRRPRHLRMASLQPASIAAVLTFIATAMITANLVRAFA